MSDFKVTIGLEVHAQLLTHTKMFCGCVATYGEAPNTRTCPVCLGLPGALPTPNRSAALMAVKVGLAAGCTIARHTKFDRKNYFYPDLPKGYQISQFDKPLCEGGGVNIRGAFGTKRVGFIRIHLEEDAGKSLHGDPDGTLVDLNRCGVPLIEIVSAPDMTSQSEAYAYLTEVRRLVRWLKVCDGNLEEGSLRCDANISVAPEGEPRGVPVEIKNLNSFHGVERAIKYEVERQSEVIRNGGKITRMTLLWDADRGETRPMRTKEAAHDYRYFPEPDLVLLEVTAEMLAAARAATPELPWARRERLVARGVKEDDADILTSDLEFAEFFEDVNAELEVQSANCKVQSAMHPALSTQHSALISARWVVGEALRWRNQLGGGERFVVPAAATASVARLEAEGRISGIAAKKVFEELAHTGRSDADAIVRERGLEQVSDADAIEAAVRKVIADNPKEVERFRAGDLKLKGFFVGQVMKATGGKADPKVTGDVLDKCVSALVGKRRRDGG